MGLINRKSFTGQEANLRVREVGQAGFNAPPRPVVCPGGGPRAKRIDYNFTDVQKCLAVSICINRDRISTDIEAID